MTSRQLQGLQAIPAVFGGAWTALLFPGTSFIWWILGNLVYFCLAAFAATTRISTAAQWDTARRLLVVGAIVFALTNATAASIACGTGGTCKLVIGTMLLVLPIQVFVILLGGRAIQIS